jgi:MFS family permease
LLIVEFLAAAAVFCQVTALGKQVYDLTGSELDLGLLGLAEFLPTALLVLVTGSVADRVDRRVVAGAGLAGEALCSLGLAWYTATGPTSLGPIYALVVLFGVSRAFVGPAVRALPANVALPGTLPKVVAMYAGCWQLSSIVGPVAAGLLYTQGPAYPYLAAAVASFASVAAMPLVVMRQRDPVNRDERPSVRSALLGLRFIRRTPILFGAISLDLFAVLFGGAVALLPVLAEERYGVGAVGFGWLRAAAGIGAALVALMLAVRSIEQHVGKVLLASVAVFGVATVVLATTRSFVVAFITLMVLAGADMVSVFVRATIVPLVTPDDARGRVLAVEQVFIGASNELGAFESGVTGQWLGASTAVALGGFATIAVVGVWWFAFPALRDVDRFGDLEVPSAASPITGGSGQGAAPRAAQLE